MLNLKPLFGPQYLSSDLYCLKILTNDLDTNDLTNCIIVELEKKDI